MKACNKNKIVSSDSQRIKIEMFLLDSYTNRSYNGSVIESPSTKTRH